LQKARRPLVRVFLIGGMIMSSFTVLYSFSRGAFVGFTAMVIYLWWRSAHKFRSGLLLAAAVLAIFAVMPPAYWQRIQSVKEYSTEGSAQGRLDAWKGGFKMMRDSPLLGCGIGNFSRAYGTQYNTINTRWTAAHSMYIEFIGQLGVPGILFILATIVLTLRTFRRTRQISRRYRGQEFRSLETIMLGAECGFVSYLVATFFLSSMTYPHLWHFGAMSGFGLQIVKRLRQQVGSPLPTG
jgi:O-antigen ligase